MATTAEPKESSSSSQREFKRIEPEEYFRQHIYQASLSIDEDRNYT